VEVAVVELMAMKIENAVPRLVCLTISVVISGCVARADVDTMATEQTQLRNLVATDRAQVEGFDMRLRRLEDSVQQIKQSGAAPGAPAAPDKSMDDRVSRLEAAVTALQAASAVSASAPTIPPTSTVGTTSDSDIPRPTSSATTPSTRTAAASPPDSSGLSSGPVGGVSIDADLDREIVAAQSSKEPGAKLYREGLEAMKAGSYAKAIEKLGLLQKKYPKSELTEPGEYFSANAFAQLGKHDQAILQLNDLVMRFPKGRYATTALLREAQSFMKLNDRIDARLTLQKLINEHSDAPEVATARDMMKQLERD
jgi:TolA-binding protein